MPLPPSSMPRLAAKKMDRTPAPPSALPGLSRPAVPGSATRSQKQEYAAKREGLRGVITMKNGDKYKGEWSNDKRHGKGKNVSPDGTVYDGDWANGFRDGYGVVTLKGPAGKQVKQYAGTFKGGRKWGHGTFFYSADGVERYEGEWFENLRSGWGRMYYSDGSIYEGEWLQDQRCGRGLLLLPNQDRYEGFWQDDVKHGDGVYYYVAKGTCYAGVWKNGSPKCGEMMDINPDAPDARRHALPELRLADPDAVLDAAAEQHAQED